MQAARQKVAKKGRRQVATWLVFKQEPGFDRIERYSDILTSLSVFGDPPREFIDRCHQLEIEVYQRCRKHEGPSRDGRGAGPAGDRVLALQQRR
jgi:hypothetical protein